MKRYISELTKVGSKMSSKPVHTLFVILVLVLSSCKGQKNTAASNNEATPQMELILQDNYSGSEVEETLVIRDKKSLESFFGKINRTRKPGLPMPDIDFKKEMLFVWCAGEGVNYLPELSIKNETKEAYVLSKGKERKRAGTTALISPFKIYKLPVSSKKIVFE